jgi:hypothetical protein
MADGQIVVRTKDGVTQSTAVPEASAGGAATLFHDWDRFEVDYVVSDTYEIYSFTLDQRSTVYITGSAMGRDTRRWFTFRFLVSGPGTAFQSQPDYLSNMFDVTRDDNMDNFDVVTLDAGEWTLYADINILQALTMDWMINVVVGENTENTTMIAVA